ncbi:MAG: hypothetical protein ABJN40_23035 [Sneathiella sp.]
MQTRTDSKMRKGSLILASLTVGAGLLLAPASYANTSPDPANQAEKSLQKAAQETSVFSASSVALIELVNQQATPIVLSFKTIKDLPADVSADGVKIKGYSQYVEVEGRKVGQVIITGLEKEGRSATLDPNSFNSQFDLEEATLAPDRKIDVEGDRAALIEALRLLNKEPEEEEEEDKPTSQAEGPADTAQNTGGNDQAKSYETPERLEIAPNPTVTVETTTSGCSVRVDYPQLVAVQQSKTVYYEDGIQTSEDECSDSEVRYPLQRSYEVCSDTVDLQGMTANAQYTWYYVDQGQARQDVSDCEADPEKIFPITEKQSCSVSLDFENKQAVIQTALIYNNVNGLETKVRDCEASLSIPPLPLTQNTDTCALKHNFAGGYSEEMGTWTYEYEGVIYQATLCTNTEVTFTHNKVYKTAGGTDLCSVSVNMESREAVPMYRLQIEREGQAEFISECTPDEAGAFNITATTDGCSDPSIWDHDLAGGISYAKERFYYDNPSRIYVTECLRSETTYSHNVSTTGWQNHDDTKSSYPLSTVTLNIDEVPYEVASSQVLPGASLSPYIYQSTHEDIISNSYAGCDVIRNTAEVEEYKRPDGTDYSEVIGEGTPIGPLDVCDPEVTTITWNKLEEFDPYLASTYLTRTTCSQTDQGGGTSYYPCDKKVYEWKREGIFEGERIRTREDGQALTETSSRTYQIVCREKSTYTRGPLNPPLASCNTIGGSSTWNAEEGW